MFVKSAIYSLALVALLPVGHAEDVKVCGPKYSVEREACKPTDKIRSWGKGRVDHVPVSQGACDVDTSQIIGGFCNLHDTSKMRSEHPGSRNFIAIEGHTEGTSGKACGDVWHMKPKVDVFCTFEYEQPNYAMVTDESCSVAGVVDDNKCFGGDAAVNIDIASVQSCLKLKTDTEAGWWQQGKCLTDIVKAAESSRLVSSSMNGELYDQITLRLKVVLNKTANTPSLSKLNQQMKEDLK